MTETFVSQVFLVEHRSVALRGGEVDASSLAALAVHVGVADAHGFSPLYTNKAPPGGRSAHQRLDLLEKVDLRRQLRLPASHCGRFHRDESEDLQQVILHDIADDPCKEVSHLVRPCTAAADFVGDHAGVMLPTEAIEVAAPPTGAEVLFEVDFDALDVVLPTAEERR